jgi:hypothetical protein
LVEIPEESLGKVIAYIYLDDGLKIEGIIDDLDRKKSYLKSYDFANIQVGKDATKKIKR